MTLTIKEREVELGYLLKNEQEIQEALKEGPNSYLADQLKAIQISIRNQRLELKKDKGNVSQAP